MSAVTPGGLTPEDRALAGELSLRVLSPTEEAVARARREADPEFAAETDAWDARLAALADEVPPVAPSPGVWAAVSARLWGAANDNARVTFWRRWAVGASALAAASVAGLAILATRPDAPAPVVAPAAPAGVTRVATLQLDSGTTAVTLAYDTATGALYVAPTSEMGAQAGAVPHLWLVLPDDAGVQLIGAIDPASPATHSLPMTLRNMAGAAPAVAISMEAPGHTPGANAPDGPVVAQGEMAGI